ncbi:hypothetical protein T4D_4959 [Trichinella pseudospiralis]|uniref:Uncharacterized protein n=1 Tax=Trichinella pseudospiralis TaxID=6337 RepID=A0A0V1DQX2_TRIPS|nr:hypothetical protein T4D_4959 [Trichinella pseudospiralis]
MIFYFSVFYRPYSLISAVSAIMFILFLSNKPYGILGNHNLFALYVLPYET